MSIKFGGLKRFIEEDSEKKLSLLPEWTRHLEWPTQNGQMLPSPYTEITHEEWLLAGLCSEYSPLASFYDGMNIPGEPEWFGGWSCYTDIYYEYGLVVAKMNFSRGMPDHVQKPVIGKGITVDRHEWTTFALRFFRIGCQHNWIDIPEESRMCYHVSKCSKCGQRSAIDSSG